LRKPTNVVDSSSSCDDCNSSFSSGIEIDILTTTSLKRSTSLPILNKREFTLKIDCDSKFYIRQQKPLITKRSKASTPPPVWFSTKYSNLSEYNTHRKRHQHHSPTTSILTPHPSPSPPPSLLSKLYDNESILPIYSNSKLALLSMNEFSEKRKEIYCNGFGVNIQNRLLSFFTSSEIERPRPFKLFEPIVYSMHFKEHRFIPTRITNAAYWDFVSRLKDLSDQEIRINRNKLDWNYLSMHYAFDENDIHNYQSFINYERFLTNENTTNIIKRNVCQTLFNSNKSSYYDKFQLLELMSKRDFNRNVHWVFLNFTNEIIMKKIKCLYSNELADTECHNIDSIMKILYDEFNIPKLSSFKL
jgi:hypothetical protein